VVVIGPSATGKSAFVRRLHERRLVTVHPTWTTRPRRPDERGGSVEHRFVSEERFARLRAEGFFAETARPFGLPHRYGLPPVAPAGPVDLLMLRAAWVGRCARLVDRFVVYQIEACPRRCMLRLAGRGSSLTEIAARMAEHRREAALGRALADRVFLNDGPLDLLVDAVARAIAQDAQGPACGLLGVAS
jgi:ribose 1,5-bisphosphokinase PhnN